MYLTTMEGPGLIILQSMPFGKFVNAVRPPQVGGGDDSGTGDEAGNANESG